MGFKRIAQADYEGALELFLEATEDLAARFGVDGKPASFLSGIGSAYHHFGFYATAESYLEEAKGKLDEASPSRVRASVHNKLGLVLFLPGDRERSERELRAALLACEGAGDEAGVVHVLERWDGTGYPRGLKAEAIPMGGRIMAVADVYDAMRSPRPYKRPLGHDETVRYILDCCGSHFDPAVSAAFKRSAEEFDRIVNEG